jgi:hypothetical protein
MTRFELKHPLTFIIGLLLTISLLWPLVAAPYFSHHDDVQVIRLHQMNTCIEDWQIPCRWVPDLGGEYGYPLFEFYAPLAYYVGEIYYKVTGSFMVAAKLMFVTSFVGAFVFMYLLGRRLWGDVGGMLSGVFYSFAPYHAVDFYVRGAMGEMWALMFFPAILWALVRLHSKRSTFNTALLAISMAGLVLSHNLSAMIFLPITLAFALILFWQERSKYFLIITGLALLLGLVISAFYWMPASAEKSLIHIDTTTVGYFSYTEHFKGLRKLLIDQSWGWGPSLREVPGGERDGMSYQIGWVHELTFVLALYLGFRGYKRDVGEKRKRRILQMILGLSLLVVVVSIFMIHPRSLFVWKIVDDYIKYLQFPWRFLMLVIVFISLAVGSLSQTLPSKYKHHIVLGLVVLVVAFNFSFFRPEKFLYFQESDLFTGNLWDKQIKRSIYDYLPIYAEAPPAELATEKYQILEGDVVVKDYNQGSNWISMHLVSNSERMIIRLSQYYFPNWQIRANDQLIPIDYGNPLGLMTVLLGKGDFYLEARLYDTPLRTLCNWLSFGGILITLGLMLSRSKYVCKMCSYAFKGFGR